MKKLKKILYYTLLFAFVGVFLFCAWQLIAYYSESRQTQAEYDSFAQIMEQARPTQEAGAEKEPFDWSKYTKGDLSAPIEMPDSPYVTVTVPETGKSMALLPEFGELYLINQDLVGWISIEDTNVNYPVVQRKDETDYYLYRDFNGVRRARGCIYVREQCDVFAPSDNVVMYGHMMNDGTMFADLSNYTKKSFWEEHQYIRFDTLRERHTYQIVCVLKTTAAEGQGFSYHLFNDAVYASDFDEFWAGCKENELYDTGLSVRYGDKLITLSTCEYTQQNGRLVIVAKRID